MAPIFFYVYLFFQIITYNRFSSVNNLYFNNPLKVESDSSNLSIINLTDEPNRLYFIDIYNNINFLKLGENNILFESKYFQLIDGKYKISYFLKKKERVIIKSNDYLILDVHDLDRNCELKFSELFFNKFDKDNLNKWTFQISKLENKYLFNPERREIEFRNEYLNTLSFFNTYYSNNKLSFDFKELMNNVLFYRVLNKKLTLGDKAQKFTNNYTYKLHNESIKFFQNSDYLFLDSYRNALFSHSNIPKDNSLVNLKNILLLQKYPQKNYDWILLNKLLIYINNDNYTTNFNSLKSLFFETCNTPEFLEYFSKSEAIKNNKFKVNEVLSIDLKNVTLKFDSNNFTYIDFWATWCGPCRAEMPYYKKLIDKYKSKGIDFVFLSIDNNPAAWERISRQLGLENSYLVPKKSNIDLLKVLRLVSIPRYIILDKNGNVLNNNAPRPSDANLELLFNSLINK